MLLFWVEFIKNYCVLSCKQVLPFHSSFGWVAFMTNHKISMVQVMTGPVFINIFCLY